VLAHPLGVEGGSDIETVILLAHQAHVSGGPHHHVYHSGPVSGATSLQHRAHPHTGAGSNRGEGRGAGDGRYAQTVEPSRCDDHPGLDTLLTAMTPNRESPVSVAHRAQLCGSSVCKNDTLLYGRTDEGTVQCLPGQHYGVREGHGRGPPPARHSKLVQPGGSGHQTTEARVTQRLLRSPIHAGPTDLPSGKRLALQKQNRATPPAELPGYHGTGGPGTHHHYVPEPLVQRAPGS